MTTAKHPDRRARFIAEYRANGRHGTKAAISAGYSKKTAHAQATRLLKDVKVSAEIARLDGKVFERLDLSAQNTLEELRRVLHFDPGQIFNEDGGMRPISDLPAEVRSCIASVEAKEFYGTAGEDGVQPVIGRIIKLKFWNKMAAISKAMDHFALAAGPLAASLPQPAEQAAREAEDMALIEAMLKAKETLWHGGGNVVPITSAPPKKAG